MSDHVRIYVNKHIALANTAKQVFISFSIVLLTCIVAKVLFIELVCHKPREALTQCN